MITLVIFKIFLPLPGAVRSWAAGARLAPGNAIGDVAGSLGPAAAILGNGGCACLLRSLPGGRPLRSDAFAAPYARGAGGHRVG